MTFIDALKEDIEGRYPATKQEAARQSDAFYKAGNELKAIIDALPDNATGLALDAYLNDTLLEIRREEDYYELLVSELADEEDSCCGEYNSERLTSRELGLIGRV